MRAVEQLHYGWARRGLEGRDQFQLVGLSRGLHRDQKLVANARQLCAYAPAKHDDESASFGWIDDAGTRYAFHRRDCGLDAYGRPGAFAVHMLVGGIRDLPALAVLRSFGSGLWWDGSQPEDPSEPLPSIDISEFDAAPRVESSDTIGELVGLLLVHPTMSGARIRCGSTELARAALALETIFPGFMDRRSFSTFETLPRVRWFDICGVDVDVDDATSASARLDRETRQRWSRSVAAVTSGDPATVQLARVALAAGTDSNGATASSAVMDLLDAMLAMQEASSVDYRRLVPALRVGGGAIEVIGDLTARNALIDAAIAGDQGVWDALGAAVSDRRVAELLAHEFITHATTVGRPSAFAQTWCRVCAWGDGARTTAVETLLRTPDLGPQVLVDLGRDECEAILRLAAACRGARPEVIDMLLAMLPAEAGPFVSDSHVPVQWRAQVLARALREGHVAPKVIRRLLPEDPSLASALGPLATRELSHVLAQVDVDEAVPIAVCAVRDLDDAGLSMFLDVLGRPARLPVAQARHRRQPIPRDSRWAGLLDDSARAIIERSLADLRSLPGLSARERQLLVDVGAGASIWVALSTACDEQSASTRDRETAALMQAIEAVASLPESEERDTATAFVLDALIGSFAQTVGELDRRADHAAERLGIPFRQAAASVLRGALRRDRRDWRQARGALALCWIASHLAAGDLRVGRIRSDLSGEIDELVKAVARQMQWAGLRQVDTWVARSASKAATRWWEKVCEEFERVPTLALAARPPVDLNGREPRGRERRRSR